MKCFVGSNELKMSLAFKPVQHIGHKVHIEKDAINK